MKASMLRLIGLLGSWSVRCLRSGRTRSKERLYNKVAMNTPNNYSALIEHIINDIKEAAIDMNMEPKDIVSRYMEALVQDVEEELL